MAIELGFQAELPNGKPIFVDHKGMIDFDILSKEKGIERSRLPSHESVAFNMGRDAIGQKGRHLRNDELPTSRSDVLHLV